MNYVDLVTQTPAYVLDEALLLKNLDVLKKVKELTGCEIILALKAFSMFSVFPIISEYLDGTTASSLNEARLGSEFFGKNVHMYIPVYREEEFSEICSYSSHITFNSVSQFNKYYMCSDLDGKKIAVRINPEHSTGRVPLYDPCSTHSRLGVTIDKLSKEIIEKLDGVHFHCLCEQNSDDLESTLRAVEEKFGNYLYDLKWVNFGGGHHITRDDYDLDLLCKLINDFKKKYNVQVILEPGEAVVLNAGFLVSEVLDIVENGMNIALLDASAAAHMPDVIEMPYRPDVSHSYYYDEKPFKYRFAGNTCLAGDIIGDYSFEKPLCVGDKVVFKDMALYTMVKNNTFNGINLPDIGIVEDGKYRVVKSFGYNDFKSRLS